VIDTTAIGTGRDVELMHSTAQAAGINVIASTGLDAELGVPACFARMTAPQIAGVLVTELGDAIPGTAVTAGAITLTTVAGDEALADVMLRAVAFAYAEIAVPVIVRSGGERSLNDAARLMALGIDPEQILAARLDGPDAGFGLIDRGHKLGIHLGFTRIGQDDAIGESARAALVAYALQRSGAERICLSMGSWAHHFPCGPLDLDEAPRGFGFIDGFVEQLASFGVQPDFVRTAMTAGARALFDR
jgi:predicted metal-dependent phosphotriesterase family hydrolase